MSFYTEIAPVKDLHRAFDPAHYHPAPDAWRLVMTDIERSTEAIAGGHQKAVNMIAAAGIAAVRNACAGHELPYSFGGDGATLLVPPDEAPAALTALAGVRASAGLVDLTLRAGAIAVGELRARGYDVLVARYEPAPGVSFAMFRGGGVGFLDRVLKGREPGVPASLVILPPEAADPDLTGLSCRFEPIASRGGCTVAVVVVMLGGNEDYRPVLDKILDFAGDDPRPISAETLAATLRRRWLPSARTLGIELDVGQSAAMPSRLRRRVSTTVGWLALQVSLRFGLSLGGHGAREALAEKVRHSDFCSADDGLQMVIDCTPRDLERIETYLAELEAAGALVFGLHVSDSALMTCLVDAGAPDRHVHFIDGAGGGYTLAAKMMKAKLRARVSP